MATKPTAARGKTTRKEKFKRKARDVLTRMSLVRDTGEMSPGAMGGKTPRKNVEDMDLSKMRKRVDEIAKIMGTGVLGGASEQLKKALKEEKDAARPAPFNDGGVIDMTTEVDVE